MHLPEPIRAFLTDPVSMGTFVVVAYVMAFAAFTLALWRPRRSAGNPIIVPPIPPGSMGTLTIESNGTARLAFKPAPVDPGDKLALLRDRVHAESTRLDTVQARVMDLEAATPERRRRGFLRPFP